MKRRIKTGICLAAACLIAAGVVKIAAVNREYPQVVTEKIIKGDSADIGDGVLMCLKGTEYRSAEEAVAEYGEAFTDEMEEGYDYVVAEVTVEMENTTDKEQDIPLYEIYIESENYCNGLAPEVYFCLSDDMAMEQTLPAGETRTVKLGYVLYEVQFNRRQWEHLEEEEFYLVREMYPVKKCWLVS